MFIRTTARARGRVQLLNASSFTTGASKLSLNLSLTQIHSSSHIFGVSAHWQADYGVLLQPVNAKVHNDIMVFSRNVLSAEADIFTTSFHRWTQY